MDLFPHCFISATRQKVNNNNFKISFERKHDIKMAVSSWNRLIVIGWFWIHRIIFLCHSVFGFYDFEGLGGKGSENLVHVAYYAA